jgi:hypothetical protein
MAGGRPPKYDSAETLQALIDQYFADCKAADKPPTVSGLAYELDITTETLRAYGHDAEFSATIKRAKQRIEMFLEESLHNPSCTGTIFNLKNNFGWKDKQEQHITGVLSVGDLTDDQLARIATGSS